MTQFQTGPSASHGLYPSYQPYEPPAGPRPPTPPAADGSIDFYGRATGFWAQAMTNMRPWNEFADRSSLSAPAAGEVRERLERNAAHFLGNYTILFLVMAAIAFQRRPTTSGLALTAVWLAVGRRSNPWAQSDGQATSKIEIEYRSSRSKP
eukprot:tig00021617_g22934.t1